MVTIYDIARKLGLSAATVSRVVNGVDHPVSERTRRRILDTAGEMGYRPNTIAKSLSRGRTQTIAILLPSITNDFYTQFVDVVENKISGAGYSTFLCNTHRDISRETAWIGTLIERRVDGVVFCPTRVKPGDNAQNLNNVRELSRHGVPVVAIGSHFGAVSQVYVDTYEGSREAVEYLLTLGHRRIGFIDGLSAGTSRRRFRGYADALKKHGITPDPLFQVHGDLSFESGRQCALRLLREASPSAVFAVNNNMAVGVLEAAREQKIQVPGQLSVIGFDDSPVSQMVYPRLTVVRQPLEEIGKAVLGLLSEAIEGKNAPRVIRLKPQLIRRDSCAPEPERRGQARIRF